MNLLLKLILLLAAVSMVLSLPVKEEEHKVEESEVPLAKDDLKTANTFLLNYGYGGWGGWGGYYGGWRGLPHYGYGYGYPFYW